MNGLIVPKTLTDYLNARREGLKLYATGLAIIQDAKRALNTCGDYIFPYDAEPRSKLDDFTRDIDKRLWAAAFAQTGCLQYMDAQAKRAFDRDLETAPPEFTEENIKTTFFC